MYILKRVEKTDAFSVIDLHHFILFYVIFCLSFPTNKWAVMCESNFRKLQRTSVNQ